MMRNIGLLGGVVLATALATGCKADCKDVGSCGSDYQGAHPNCDGHWYYDNTHQKCEACPSRNEDTGAWSYPNGEVWNPGSSEIACASGGTSSEVATGGRGGAGGTASEGPAAGGKGGESQPVAEGGTSGAGGTVGAGGAESSAAGGSGGDSPVTACSSGDLMLGQCAPSEVDGVFVSPEGDDATGLGTRTQPYRSFHLAIEGIRSGAAKRIFACTTESTSLYPEKVVVGEGLNGLELYGGFRCGTWARVSGAVPEIASPEPEGMVVDSISGLKLVDVKIRAASGTTEQRNSVALFVRKSTQVELTRVALVAGDGSEGAKGDSIHFDFTKLPSLTGSVGEVSKGGAGCAVQVKCPGTDKAPNAGGQGGDPLPSTNNDGAPGQPGGKPNTPAECAENQGGWIGQPKPPDPVDGLSATLLGSLDANGFTPGDGAPGQVGLPGQGGGGGAAIDDSGGGGGGACGGCGGAGAQPGKGGGSSIALLSFESDVSVQSSSFTTGVGAKGGDGVIGQTGQTGGGKKGGSGQACAGGQGGPGQAGGSSGGGAGGNSIGILSQGVGEMAQGMKLEVADNTFTTGTSGKGGLAESGKVRAAGRDGKRADVSTVTALNAIP